MPALSTAEGAERLWEGAGGAGGGRVPVSPSPCSWAGGVQAGPGGGRGVIRSSETRGAGISPAAPRGVPGRSGQRGEGDGERPGHRWLAQPCPVGPAPRGITGDSPTARLGAAGPERGTALRGGAEVPSTKPWWVLGIKAPLEALDAPNRQKQEPELSLPPLPCPAGNPETMSPSGRGRSPPGMYQLPGGDAQGPPRASRGLARTRAGGRLGSPSVTSALGRHPPQPRRAVPAWPGPNALRRPPRPGSSQVLERSWERIPWPRCGSAHAPGDPRASPCQGLISRLTRCCFKSALILPSPAGSQL